MRPATPLNTAVMNAADPAALDQAVDILAAGGCIAAPTETVYGLAADAGSDAAVAGIYAAKGRPKFNPLIAHVDTLERARALIDLPDAALRLAEALWPGPLTLVAARKRGAPVSALAAAGLDTLAVRLPASPTLRSLVARLDRPLAAPSANRSGEISPTTADHVKAGLNGRIDLILDGGPCAVGVESTIVSFIDPQNPEILRAGGLERSLIEAHAGPLSASPSKCSKLHRPHAPGQLSTHYAPKAKLRLNASEPAAGEAFLAFGPFNPKEAYDFINLSDRADLVEAAANLFSSLHALDAIAERIAVAPIPDHGLGEAINDRLRRAATR